MDIKNIRLLFCAMIAEMDLAVNNLINVYFISRGIGSDGSAAYELVMPCLMVVSACMALGYNGVQAVCSKDYGANDRGMLARHKNAGYSWMIIVIAVITALFIAFKAPVLEMLGANDSGPVITELSSECYTAFLPCYMFQSLFCIASCLLFLEERRQLVIANIVLYTVSLTGNTVVTALFPSMTNYILVNVFSEVAADLYLFTYFFMNRKTSVAAFTSFHVKIRDVKDIFFTGLPDFMEYVFVAAMFYVENMYILYRFSSSLIAGLGIFEAIENIPEMICVGVSFLITASFGTRAGRLIRAKSPDEVKDASTDLHDTAKKLTKGIVTGSVLLAVLLTTLARPLTDLFLKGSSDAAAAESSVLLITAYALGFIFYMLNSELVCYYKIVKAYIFAHIIYFAEGFALPIAAKILLGEIFGLPGFCMGGLAAESLAFLLNICLVWTACGHFPVKLDDFRMDKWLTRA